MPPINASEIKPTKILDGDGYPPKEYFVDQFGITELQYKNFKELVEKNAGETEIDIFLKENPEVLANSLSFLQTGHQGAWVVSQQVIKPPTNSGGLKPDYVLGGKSSSGIEWYVIDLKGANGLNFSEKGNRTFFSPTTNMGVFQVLEYINYCAKMQSYMREGLSLVDFREPTGILIIGREKELSNDAKRRELRAAWNRLNDKLQVRTYDALLRP